jgi:hypothetical protein
MNLLRKEKDGKLNKFQHVKEAFTGGDSAGHPSDVSGGWDDDGAAKPVKRRGELPAEVKSTTMSTKEGSIRDRLRAAAVGAGAVAKQQVKDVADHAAAVGHKAQLESAEEVGRHAGRAVVQNVKEDAKKVWDSHKGKIIGGAAAAYGANKAIDYGIHKHAAFFDEFCKIATVPGAMGSVNPFNTGENPLASPETRQKPSRGDIPTQGQDQNISDRTDTTVTNPSTATGAAPGSDLFAPGTNKVRRRGDVPGQPKDPSAVSYLDARESATTITGLAQNSDNIGAFNSPAEHSG